MLQALEKLYRLVASASSRHGHVGMRLSLRVGLIVLIATTIPNALAATYNMCQSGRGLIFVQTPCPPGTQLQQSGVEGPKPKKYVIADPFAARPQMPPRDIDGNVYGTLVMKQVCDAHMPGFREKSASAYARWAAVNAAAIVKIEQLPDFQGQIEKMRISAGTDADRQFVQERCSDEFVSRLQAESHSPNPKYATPELTWNTFFAALRAADRMAANDALDDDHERKKFEPILKQFTDQQLRDMGNSFNGFKLGKSYEPFTEAFVSRTNGQVGSVTFIKVLGEWKIYEM